MSERTLEQRYRLLGAGFRDSPRSAAFREHLRAGFDQALELLLHVLAFDLGVAPADLDQEQLGTVMRSLLPGRITGAEEYRHDLPDVLEALLQFIAEDQSLPRGWEWSAAIEAERDAYRAAIANASRPRANAAAAPKREPDRRPAPKLGRNDPCFCGSGKKYKQCCLKLLP